MTALFLFFERTFSLPYLFFIYFKYYFFCFFSNILGKGSRWLKLSPPPASHLRLLLLRSVRLPPRSPLHLPNAGLTSRIGSWPVITANRPVTLLHDALPVPLPLLLRLLRPLQKVRSLSCLSFLLFLLNKIVFLLFILILLFGNSYLL